MNIIQYLNEIEILILKTYEFEHKVHISQLRKYLIWVNSIMVIILVHLITNYHIKI